MQEHNYRVCHVTSVHTSNDARIFHKMCVSLAKAGYDVCHVAPGESRQDNGVSVIGLGEKPASRFRRMMSWAKRVYQTTIDVDADLYHLHAPGLLRFALKLKRNGKAVIFDSHEFYGLQILGKHWILPFCGT